jgi:general secretion pathway protein I
MRSEGHRERGFTLLEVLIAFTIATLALAMLFRGAGAGMVSAERAGRYEEAVSRAKSHLAAIGRNAAVAPGDAEGDDGNGFRWRLHVTQVAVSQPADRNGPGGQVVNGMASNVQSPPVALFAISVAVSWMEQGRRREVRLGTERLGQPSAGNG